MLRIFNQSSALWHERTMSYMQNAELERAENWLRTLQPLHLFGGCRDKDLIQLWSNSYDAMEYPHSPMMEHVSDWENRIMERLPSELHLLTSAEYGLLHRLLIQKGKILLLNRGELHPCVSFIRRMWAYPVLQANGTITLIMPDPILFALYEHTDSPDFLQHSYHQSDFLKKTELILLAQGFLPMDVALEAYGAIIGQEYANSLELCTRLLKISCDYTIMKGQTVLIHSSIFDPAPFLPALETYPRDIYSSDLEKSMDDWNTCEDVFQILSGLLSHAIRGDLQSDELVGDLALLARQNVPYQGLFEVLRDNLLVYPTQEMTACLRMLKNYVPVWPVFRSEVVS